MNEANVHISKNINGRETELHLCDSCARDSGELLSVNRFLGSFIESVMPLRVRRVAYMPPGTQGGSKYAGCEDCVEDLPAYKHGDMAPPLPDKEETKLADLKSQMKQAVEKEEFERAARLRDEIKRLEGKQGE
jgi:protein arginine kinase activator